MKRILCMIISTILLLCSFSACHDPLDTAIPSDVANTIIQDYWDTYCSEYEDSEFPIPIKWLSIRCCGIFEDVYVVFVDGAFGYTYEEKNVTVANVKFHYPSTQELLVYSNGEFYTLQEAYDSQLLTVQELGKLPRDFSENAFLALDSKKKSEITNAYHDKHGVQILDSDWLTAEDVGQWPGGGLVYLGSDNGYDILYKQTYMTAVWEEQIAEQDFISTSSFYLMAYKDGVFHKLNVAYKDGLVSKDAIVSAGRVNRMYYMAYWQKIYYHWNG